MVACDDMGMETITFDQLNEKLGGSETQSEWHQHKNGGGWVHESAKVDESAYVGPKAAVYGDARVYGDALVYGDARVYGNAWVYGNARVCGNAWNKSPLFIVGSRYSLTNCKYGHIQIGCKCGTFDWWLKNGEEVAKAEGFSDEEIAEYRAYVELFVKIGK